METNKPSCSFRGPKAPWEPNDRDPPSPCDPKAATKPDQPPAVLRGPKPSSESAESPKPPSDFFEDRSPLRRPLQARTSAGCLRRPKPPSDRTCGRDGPESIVAFRGLIPAAVRHSHASCLGRYVARSSPGLVPSRVFPLSAAARPSPNLPSWAYISGRERPSMRPFRVSTTARLAGLSRDCRPSWALTPFDLHERWARQRFGSRLLRPRGASPSPDRPSLNRFLLPGRSRS
jgi:hypothetical protein